MKVKAKFHCNRCSRRWSSNNVFLSFNMRAKTVSDILGQKCKKCRGRFLRPLPFCFFQEENQEIGWWYNSKTKWYLKLLFNKLILLRYIINLALDKLVRRLTGTESSRVENGPRGGPPHEAALCQRCQRLGRPCTERGRDGVLALTQQFQHIFI